MSGGPRLTLVAHLTVCAALTGCLDAQPLGSHTPQLGLASRTHVMAHGVPTVIEGVALIATVTRGPGPFGLRLTATLRTARGASRTVREDDVVPIRGHAYRVISVRAVLRDGELSGREVRLLRE